MSSRLGYKLPKPTDAKRFEQMVRDCANKKYDKKFSLYGRTGQNQHGIDIYCVDRFAEVIQCKNYTSNDMKALEKAVQGDFEKAYKYFYGEKNWHFTSFIIATSADKDTVGDDVIIKNNLHSDIKVEIWFWEDIEEIILENPDLLWKYYQAFIFNEKELRKVHTDNEAYAKSFSEPLFLHKNDSKVNLCNLFVMPKYDNSKTDLEEKLSAFVKSDERFLFIEGDAGCGKSTLVSWMNYHLQNNDDTAKNTFGDRQVITIRLRDLDRDVIKSKQGLIDSILKHMKLETCDDMEERFSKAVMILDGFDELCMIDNIENYNELIEELAEIELDGYQYIITSRPHYIKKEIDSSCEFITLQHFDKDKRTEWIGHYTSPEFCNQPLNDEIKKYIVSISDDTDSAICDTPMTLYMLVAKDISIDLTKNSWKLYHHIFYNELLETDYNKMFGRKHKHEIRRYKDIFYKVTEEIAYQMYLSNNNQFYVSSGELRKIIKKLLDNDTRLTNKRINYLIEQCYALCNYWKETGDGAVEFYHNNIRDFFLCEKIYRELNAIYADYKLSKNDKIGKLIEFFKQFTKAPLQDMVCNFIFLRAEKDVNDKNSFVYKEKNQRLLPYLFEEMLTNGTLYNNLNEKQYIQAIINILSCTAQVYRHIYEYTLAEKEYMKWWNSVGNINEKSDIITYCFRYIFEHRLNRLMSGYVSISNRIDIRSLNLYDSNLRRMDFQGADLSRADLSRASLGFADLNSASLGFADLNSADLRGANLRGANLSGAYLRGANLSGAYLSGADLSRADLSRANLRDADLRGATLIGADLGDADLRYANLSGANLSDSDLIGADLIGANLSDSDLSGADLRGATLPDGFKSYIQEEQVQHLKEMNIKGLKI